MVVAEVASFLAHRAARSGVPVDRRLVETAALLHDVDKGLPRDLIAQELGHGAAGAAWLSEAGHPELARTVAAHPVLRLSDPGAADWVARAPLEERIVSYADKRATQRLVSLEQRFARWRRKHVEYADRLSASQAMAELLESTLCEAIGIKPDDVARLPWVGDAMTRATASGRLGGSGRPIASGAAVRAAGTVAVRQRTATDSVAPVAVADAAAADRPAPS
jgi:hypothetical protein